MGVALLSILAFLVWFWNKAKQAGYAKGTADERKRSQEAMDELLKKNLAMVDNHNAGLNVSKLQPSVSEDPS